MKSITKKFLSIFLFILLITSSTTALAATTTYKPNPLIIMKQDYNGTDIVSTIVSGSYATYMLMADMYCSQNNISVNYYWTISYGGRVVTTSPTYTASVSYNSFTATGFPVYTIFSKKGTYKITLNTRRANSSEKYVAAASRSIVSR